MKAYVIVTGITFTAILIAHVLRIIAEGAHLIREPGFLLSSALSLALTTWSIGLIARGRR